MHFAIILLYHELIALGEPAVPLILRELERAPSVSWFGVLAAITGENPVPAAIAGHVAAMAGAWLEWGRPARISGVSADIEGLFPLLASDGYFVASPETPSYNCIAWAVGESHRWWEPGIYWPVQPGDDLATSGQPLRIIGLRSVR